MTFEPDFGAQEKLSLFISYVICCHPESPYITTFSTGSTPAASTIFASKFNRLNRLPGLAHFWHIAAMPYPS
jgi:hypothetical protein